LADKGLQVTPYSLVSLPQLLTPLAHGFKEENGSGLRDIQGIDLAGHGNADGKLTVPDWAYTSVLSAHDQRTGETQIDLGVALPGCGRGYQDLYEALAQPSQHLGRRGDGNGDSAEGALTGADDVRIPDVRLASADDKAGDASRIGRAQNGSQSEGSPSVSLRRTDVQEPVNAVVTRAYGFSFVLPYLFYPFSSSF
jgi:hypothetical protein